MNAPASNSLPPARSRRRKSILLRIALVGAATLVLLEVVFQLVLPPFEYVSFTQSDDYLFVRFIPGKEGEFKLRRPSILNSGSVLSSYRVRINRQGLRAERDYHIPKPAGVYRVLCLGDSITFGWGLPLSETWPELLETALSARLMGRRVEVINAGYPGYTTRQGLIWLDRELVRLEPDAVVVEFGFNDSLPSWFRTRGPIRLENDQTLMAGDPGHWVPIRRLPLEPLAYHLSETFTAKFALIIYSMLKNQNPTYAANETKGGKESTRSYEWARVPPADYRENLILIASRCRKAGARPVLVSAWGTPEAYRAVMPEVAMVSGATVVYQSEIIMQALAHPAEVAADPRFQTTIARLKKEPNPFPPGIYCLVLVDYLHPNFIGNTLFVDRLAEVLAPSPRP